MRKRLSPELESQRVTGSGLNGVFVLLGPTNATLRVTVSDGTEGGDREHVSVVVRHRTPSPAEMAKVRQLFWEDRETVYQEIDNHPTCLHLWCDQMTNGATEWEIEDMRKEREAKEVQERVEQVIKKLSEQPGPGLSAQQTRTIQWRYSS